jgi:hypothetical protein
VPSPDPFFACSNFAEAALWITIGLAFAIRAGRGRALLAAGLFVAFGATDIIEAGTGAWWRPWWLLAWKLGCIVGLLALLLARLRRRAR